MEFALIALLVSSFTCVGLLALWAATSRRHWFLRTTVYVGGLSLLLLIPAHEPFVAFALQGFVVAVGLQISTLFRNHSTYRSPRFSLITLLQMMALVCITAAIVAQLPELNWLAWQSVLLIGLTAGLSTLLAHWLVHGSGTRLRWRIPLGLFATICISLPAVFGDWFVLSICGFNGWPPERVGAIGGFLGRGYFGEGDAITTWIPVQIGITGLVALFDWLFIGIFPHTPKSTDRNKLPPIALWVLCPLTLLILVPTTAVYYQLMTPMPIPEQTTPTDNGFDDIFAGGKLAETSNFDAINFDAKTASDKALKIAVTEMDVAFERLQTGLAKEIQMPIDYDSPDGFGMPYIAALRSLARCVFGRGKLAEREGRLDDALKYHLDNVRLGYGMRSKALMVHALVGMAINGIGQQGVYELLHKLDGEQSARAVSILTRLDAECDSEESFVSRDRVFSQHANGWHGHLLQLFYDIVDPDFFANNGFHEAFQRERATSQLLSTELAIRTFRNEEGKLPRSLDELVPEYLPTIPVDPFDLEGRSLRYRVIQDRFTLYSVGVDGVDDGGELPANYAEPNYWYRNDGDLLLKHLYAPDPVVPDETDSDEFNYDGFGETDPN